MNDDPYRLLSAPGRAALVLPALRPARVPADLLPRPRLEGWMVLAAAGAAAAAAGAITSGAASAIAGAVALLAGAAVAASGRSISAAARR